MVISTLFGLSQLLLFICFYNGSHSKHNYTQLAVSHSKYPTVWSLPPLCINAYWRGKRQVWGNTKPWHGCCTLPWHRSQTGPNAFISVVQSFGKGLGIFISLYIPHSRNNKTDIKSSYPFMVTTPPSQI